jgi:uncharacterized protein (TIGR02001 family)
MKYIGLVVVACIYVGYLQAQSDDHQTKFSQTTTQKEATQEKKSTPSQDVGKKENQGKREEEKKEKKEKKEEPEKKEEEKKKEEKKEEEKPKSPHTFAASVSFVSDYRFRGISQTFRRPAVQGTLDYSHVSGFYLGTFGSNVDGTTHFYNNTSLEWDFYGGYKGKLFPCRFPDFAYNIGVIYYYYPGGRAHVPHNVRYNTCEYFIELSYKWLSMKFWQALTDYFGVNSDNPPFNWEKHRYDHSNGSSRFSTYIEANATFELREKFCWRCLHGGKLTLLLHVGHVTVRHYEQESYTDWRATLTQEFDWFNVFLSYVGTNARHAYFDIPDNEYHPKKYSLGAQGVVVGVIRSF